MTRGGDTNAEAAVADQFSRFWCVARIRTLTRIVQAADAFEGVVLQQRRIFACVETSCRRLRPEQRPPSACELAVCASAPVKRRARGRTIAFSILRIAAQLRQERFPPRGSCHSFPRRNSVPDSPGSARALRAARCPTYPNFVHRPRLPDDGLSSPAWRFFAASFSNEVLSMRRLSRAETSALPTTPLRLRPNGFDGRTRRAIASIAVSVRRS
jgi:hypothetical protein